MAILPIVRALMSDNNEACNQAHWSAPMSNAVTQIPAAAPEHAASHFETQFTFETDCWDTHAAIGGGSPGFVLLDVRSPALFATGHIRGAVNLPHAKIIAAKLSEYPKSTLFVAYCAGPHCNGAARAALRLARLGFAVKIMAGGVTGWIDEGFELHDGIRPAADALNSARI
jgi:rhodanese-related sulfurtransferase